VRNDSARLRINAERLRQSAKILTDPALQLSCWRLQATGKLGLRRSELNDGRVALLLNVEEKV
jgi:hypothetical protein